MAGPNLSTSVPNPLKVDWIPKAFTGWIYRGVVKPDARWASEYVLYSRYFTSAKMLHGSEWSQNSQRSSPISAICNELPFPDDVLDTGDMACIIGEYSGTQNPRPPFEYFWEQLIYCTLASRCNFAAAELGLQKYIQHYGWQQGDYNPRREYDGVPHKNLGFSLTGIWQPHLVRPAVAFNTGIAQKVYFTLPWPDSNDPSLEDLRAIRSYLVTTFHELPWHAASRLLRNCGFNGLAIVDRQTLQGFKFEGSGSRNPYALITTEDKYLFMEDMMIAAAGRYNVSIDYFDFLLRKALGYLPSR